MKQYDAFISDYELSETLFHKFCLHSSREEFLRFQAPFYKAVEAFPRMLCLLGMKIEDSQTRLSVVENLWEEHGQGQSDKFHTATYLNYLECLGEHFAIEHNFFVDNWVKKVLNLNYDAGEYSAYLAGIEFIYTRVSSCIVEKIKPYCIRQEHYQTHEKLDYEHAADLLKVACSIKDKDYSYVFDVAVEDFMDLLNQLTFITQAELQNIAAQSIAFYYSREDSAVELKHIQASHNVLCVASGGEHMFHIKHKYPLCVVTGLDINAHQIELVKQKHLQINKNQLKCILNTGKFELLFELLAQKLNHQDIYKIQHQDAYAEEKLRLICNDLFSHPNLDIIFTPEATRYTRKSFSEHFFKVFKTKITQLETTPSNMSNVLNLGFPCNYPDHVGTLNYWHGDFYSYPEPCQFDVISISNIGDWMALDKYGELLDYLKTRLYPEGKIIARKLLGDYSLQSIMAQRFKTIHIETDNTGFYTECIVGQL